MSGPKAKRRIEVIDQTLRDGPQSWWGMRMQEDMATPVAPLLNEAGYHVVDLVGPNIFDVLIKRHQENPWTTTSAILKGIDKTPVRAAVRSNGLFGFTLSPDSVMDLWVTELCAKGIRSFWIYDGLFQLHKIERLSRLMQAQGAEAVATMLFAESPYHTDAYYEARARELVAIGVDAIELEDASGLLMPERTRTLVRALKSVMGSLPLEVHFHSNTGLAPLNYLIAVEEGAERVHTASQPLACGVSLPSTEVTLDNLKRAGYDVGIDEGTLAPVREHMMRVAEIEGLPVGVPAEFNLAQYDHQLPGGMMGTFLNQLRDRGLEDRLPELLEEISRVRVELGYPVMATPFSQLVGIQAVLNVTGQGERYAVVPDEVLLLLAGHFGDPVAPVDQNVKDRIFSTPEARKFQSWELPQPTLDELRAKFGREVPMDELLLHLMVPSHHIAALRSHAPGKRYTAEAQTLSTLKSFIRSRTGETMTIKTPDLSLSLAGGCHG